MYSIIICSQCLVIISGFPHLQMFYLVVGSCISEVCIDIFYITIRHSNVVDVFPVYKCYI